VIERESVDWQFRAGRDWQGDLFRVWCGVHGSGRILVKIFCPVVSDEFVHRVSFYVTVPKTVLADQNECFDFIDVDSAREFALSVLSGVSLQVTPADSEPVAPVGQLRPAA
jgi:hypothetical protein